MVPCGFMWLLLSGWIKQAPITFMIVQGAGTYGSEDTTENEMIGYANGRIHEMTALLVRRARLEKLHLASIRAGYKYLFVEPGRIGKAKVKEG